MVEPAALYALLSGVRIDLSGEKAAAGSAAALAGAIADPDIRVESRYDVASETHRLVVVRTHHGTPHVTAIDSDLLASGDFAQIRAAADVLQGLMLPGALVRRGEKQQAVSTFKAALDWLLAEARGAVSLQRYKGLGEMNPAQLWETTMDPKARRLLRVQIEDAITSEEIFSTLMGDQVEPRRAFIESNALGVRNLDV
jgi:DNA gyrase subunit B